MTDFLEDPEILQQIKTALRERRCDSFDGRYCDSYVHWKQIAQNDLAKDAGVTTQLMEQLIEDTLTNGVHPKVEYQAVEEFEGQPRYFWVIPVGSIKMYVKVHVYLDQHKDPCLDIVRCHRSLQ